jgi:uncharacterized membrane protein
MLLARVVVLAVVAVLLAVLLALVLLKREVAGPPWLRIALVTASLVGVTWAALDGAVFLG